MRRTYRDIIAPGILCPNHWLTETSLTIPSHSEYTARGYAALIPLIGDISLVHKFRKANVWVTQYVATWPSVVQPQFSYSRFAHILEWLIMGTSGLALNRAVKNLQLRIMTRHRARGAPADNVRLDDTQLAFHPQSVELSVIQKYSERLFALGIGQPMR